MRILHVAPSFYPAWAYGGIPRCAYELCRVLSELGESVTVWTTDACDAERRLREQETVVDGMFVRRFRNLHNGLEHCRIVGVADAGQGGENRFCTLHAQ